MSVGAGWGQPGVEYGSLKIYHMYEWTPGLVTYRRVHEQSKYLRTSGVRFPIVREGSYKYGKGVTNMERGWI